MYKRSSPCNFSSHSTSITEGTCPANFRHSDCNSWISDSNSWISDSIAHKRNTQRMFWPSKGFINQTSSPYNFQSGARFIHTRRHPCNFWHIACNPWHSGSFILKRNSLWNFWISSHFISCGHTLQNF
uniref:Uncharacterized protein n=1 Tax=Arundo donax TaxID=35708 RepID=A0A0A9E221_ARUDO